MSRGAIKEVVAATTLAAMAMTGNTVSAFGLANALAEENAAHIEIAPAQEAYGAEFAGALADEIVAEPAEEVTAAAVDEVVAEADFDLAEESAAELTEDGELTDEEAVEELEDADLGELTGEVDADAALKQIIDEAMDANQNKGIGAALDAAFESVAFAGGDVLDPETGKLAVGEGEVVRVAAEAATARFAGLSTDQVFGAVSVAAVRASNSGLLDALGNDPVLNSMSMSEQELEQTLEHMKSGSKNAIMYTIDQLAKVSSPAFKNMILPLIKAMVGDMFDGLFPQSNEDKVMNKLNQIEQRINEVEDSIKLHTDNVVVLAAIGDKYGTVRDRAQTLAARVDNIRFNPYLTDEQKVEELAKLYKDGVVYDLETALNGATNAFNGDTEFSLEQKSVFDMAYSTAVEKSMFSQEAIEAATPYLMRQLATYLAGYAALMPVYEAYEQVYGASYLLATREVMAQRLGGVDREGHEMSSTVLQKYQAMERAVADGKLRCIGLSNYYEPEDFDRLVNATTIVLALLQNETHPYHQSTEMKTHIAQYGTVMESWFPLGGRGNTQILFDDPTIAAIAQAHGKTSAQVILRWHLQAGNIAIPGSNNPDHILENIFIFDFELTDDEMVQMTVLDRNDRFADY